MTETKSKTTQIRKRIERTIQTKQFESLHVYVEAEDTVAWNTLEERTEKSNELTKILTADFQDTMTQVMDELKLNQVKATVISQARPVLVQPMKVVNPAEAKSDDLFDNL
jgi:hypothetical protein